MPFGSQSTNFPGGVTNAGPNQTMGKAGTPDPTFAQIYANDFNTFVAADLTNSGVGGGTAALTAAQGPGGVLLVTTTAANNDTVHLQQPVGSFQLTPGKHQFFKARVALSDVINSTFYAGLAANNANPLAAVDALYLYKATAQAAFVLRSIIGGVTTDYPLPAAALAVNATFLELGFHVDTQGNVEVFFNPTTGNNQPVAGAARGRVAAAFGANLTQVLLAVSAGIVSTTALAKTLAIDFLVASAER